MGDDAVAMGAVLYAAKLNPAHKIRDFYLRDSNPFGLKVSVLPVEGASDKPVERLLFPQASSIPIAKRLTLRRANDFDIQVSYDTPEP